MTQKAPDPGDASRTPPVAGAFITPPDCPSDETTKPHEEAGQLLKKQHGVVIGTRTVYQHPRLRDLARVVEAEIARGA